MAYAVEGDLLLGGLPLPTSVSTTQYLNLAADEINEIVGQRYNIPVNIGIGATASDSTKLLLKRLNIFIATGRLLMALDIPGEQNSTHAYARKLLRDSEQALDLIAAGELDLIGVPLNSQPINTVSNGPVIVNGDDSSFVDAFYTFVETPSYFYPENRGGVYGGGY